MSFASQDSFSEVSSQSWLGRLGESIKGVIFGFILFVLAFPLLWWNEGRTIRTARGLQELGHAVVSVEADRVDPANNDKPVHITAQATSDETLTDTVFNVAAKGIKLARRVSMYQWREHQRSETKKKLGGGTETVTTYTYDKGWSGDPQNSSGSKQFEFHVQSGDQVKGVGGAGGAGDVQDSRNFKHPEGHRTSRHPSSGLPDTHHPRKNVDFQTYSKTREIQSVVGGGSVRRSGQNSRVTQKWGVLNQARKRA